MREWRFSDEGIIPLKKKEARMLLSIELSRLRIESFFCLSFPLLPYHGQLDGNPCDGSRVVSNILRIHLRPCVRSPAGLSEFSSRFW